MSTIKLRRQLLEIMQEGLAPISDRQFNRIAKVVAYLGRRMERKVA